jgi:arginine:ornithine antiporter/lysine permease
LILLSGVVVGSMIGGGSFNLPQNMASGASLGAVTIAWIVTLVGMFFLSNAFRTLADTRPDLKAGGLPVFWYAQREREPSKAPFTGTELAGAIVLVAAAITALVLFARGIVQIG